MNFCQIINYANGFLHPYSTLRTCQKTSSAFNWQILLFGLIISINGAHSKRALDWPETKVTIKYQQQQQEQEKQQHHLRMKIGEEYFSTSYRSGSKGYYDDMQKNMWTFANPYDNINKPFRKTKFLVTKDVPIHILFPLPIEEGPQELNPFGITIALTKPVVEIAVEEVYRRQLVPLNSLEIHFEDSKLSDAHGPNVAINQLVDNKLDCIIGYAFVYALAPVARMSPYWRDKDSNGIPIITSIGLTSNLDNRKEYQLMTRISSPYKVIRDAVVALFENTGWRRSAYLFHDQRHDNPNPSIPYGECYLLMASLQPHLYRFNKMEHNYFMFNELKSNPKRMQENLKKASMLTNG